MAGLGSRVRQTPAPDVDAVRERQAARPQGLLRVGSAADPAEREADRAADAILAGRAASVSADSTVRRAATGPGAAFDAGPRVAATLTHRRGQGQPLPDGIRSAAERSLGTDLSDVRVHSADRSLAGSLSALAFTYGRDIHLGPKTPDLASVGGQRMLAHELGHVAQHAAGAAPVLRRQLSVDAIDWDSVTSLTVMPGGGSGLVAEISDGTSSLMIKVDQATGNEVVAASNAHARLAGMNGRSGPAGGDFGLATPRARILTPTEIGKVKALVATFPPQDPRNFVTGLDSARPAVVMERASGDDGGDILKDPAQFSGNQPVAGSLMDAVLHNPHAQESLGRIAASDLAFGNGDRLIVMMNFSNLMYDKNSRTFHLTDNTVKSQLGLLTSRMGDLRDPLLGFQQWCGASSGGLGIRNPAGVADAIMRVLVEDNGGLKSLLGGDNTKKYQNPRADERNALIAELARVRPQLHAAILKGVQEGVQHTKQVLRTPGLLARGVEPAHQREVLQSFIARSLFAEGHAGTPQQIWDLATTKVDRTLQVGQRAQKEMDRALPEANAWDVAEKKAHVADLLDSLAGAGKLRWAVNDPARPQGQLKVLKKEGQVKRALAIGGAKDKIQQKDASRAQELTDLTEIVQWRIDRTKYVGARLMQAVRDLQTGNTDHATAVAAVKSKVKQARQKNDDAILNAGRWLKAYGKKTTRLGSELTLLQAKKTELDQANGSLRLSQNMATAQINAVAAPAAAPPAAAPPRRPAGALPGQATGRGGGLQIGKKG